MQAESKQKVSSKQFLDKSKLTYTSHYCEQNVFMACKNLEQATADSDVTAFAVFITTPTKSTCIRQQKLGKNPNNHYRVTWDYHVILVLKSKTVPAAAWVYDFDSRLDWGCSLTQYFQRSLKTGSSQIALWFRVLPAAVLLNNFASDRSHMMYNGKYMMPPPKYPPIVNKNGQAMNLFEILDTSNTNPELGVWVQAQKFLQYFQLPTSPKPNTT